MLQVYVVRADDWQGLYVNNNLTFENHSISLRDLPQGKPMTFHVIDANDALDAHVTDTGGFPASLDGVLMFLKDSK